MRRILAISDIHGELEKFERLITKINYDPTKDKLILLGDYIDRGPNPRGVVEKAMELKQQGAILLKGNHEDLMEKSFVNPVRLKQWLRNGGIETLKSYGYDLPNTEDLEELVARVYPLEKTEILAQHLEFIAQLDHFYEIDDYIFVHGGVDPKTPISKTDPYILMWIRDEFHHGYNGEKPVVFGHTPTPAFHDKNDVYFGTNNIIGIDGGCVYGGQLNALELPSRKIYHIK